MGTKTKRNRAMQEEHRQRIRVAQLLNLHDHALNDREVSATRIDAAKFLLNKAIANPPQEIKPPEGGSVSVTIVRFGDAAE